MGFWYVSYFNGRPELNFLISGDIWRHVQMSHKIHNNCLRIIPYVTGAILGLVPWIQTLIKKTIDVVLDHWIWVNSSTFWTPGFLSSFLLTSGQKMTYSRRKSSAESLCSERSFMGIPCY
ncbi:hypothetical protein F5Y04DRAFT_240832 [Hypomontagnella monticulosa]|nr:hypothetical protein F5Y04DRAFT_240832 [Hypomontagnella monticulosa]